MTHRDLLKRALDELEYLEYRARLGNGELINDIRAELARPEPEPIAWLWDNGQIRLWLDSPHLPAGVVSDIKPVPVYVKEGTYEA